MGLYHKAYFHWPTTKNMVAIDDLPGFTDDQSQERTVAVTAIYLILIAVLAPLIVLLLFFAIIPGAIIVALDWRGAASAFENIPGIEAGNALLSGASTAIYLFVAFMIVTSATTAFYPGFGGDETEMASSPTVTPTATAAPTTTVSPTATEAQTTTEPTTTDAAAQRLEIFRTNLESQGITVTDVQRSGKQIQLTYLSVESTQSGLAEEIGYVTGAYAAAVGNGEQAQRLEVVIVDAAETPIGSFFVERDWVIQYNNGEISSEELSRRVLETLGTER